MIKTKWKKYSANSKQDESLNSYLLEILEDNKETPKPILVFIYSKEKETNAKGKKELTLLAKISQDVEQKLINSYRFQIAGKFFTCCRLNVTKMKFALPAKACKNLPALMLFDKNGKLVHNIKGLQMTESKIYQAMRDLLKGDGININELSPEINKNVRKLYAIEKEHYVCQQKIKYVAKQYKKNKSVELKTSINQYKSELAKIEKIKQTLLANLNEITGLNFAGK